MSITIKEIAKLAGTSRGTVDRVINKRGNVKPELEEKINSIIEEYNYKPNINAKLLGKYRKIFKIGVILNSLGNEFYDDVKQGIYGSLDRLNEYNVQVIMKEIKGYNPIEIINKIDEVLAEGVDAIAITPINESRVIKKLIENEKKIPIALINSGLESVEYITKVVANNILIGKIAANLTMIYARDNDKIAISTGSLLNTSNRDRVEGFISVIDRDKNKKLRIVKILEVLDDDDISYKQTKALLEQHEDLKLIFLSAYGVKGAIRAINEKKSKAVLVTVDFSRDIEEALKEGVAIATITQDPFEQGYRPLVSLAEYLVFNTKCEKTVLTESKIILKESLNV
ncbi:MAG: LacI family DNA-binding transcriptional regulator [Clostridium sp.]|nr:LacI family DNA-binding transcriptional regulator [Clostridium sp.]MDU7083077.1 LacI family DNA-binding transcriptional regulator [Clostridium sp.]